MSSLGTSAQTPNQIAIAAQLDALSGNTTPEIQAIIDQVALLTPEAQRAALDSLSGETYETLSSIGLQIGEQSLRTVRNRLVNNLSFLSGGGGVVLGQRSSPRTALGGDQLVRGQSPTFGATGWFQGYGSSGSWGGNGNAAGADYRLSGFSYGADLAGDEAGVFGISGGHGSTMLGTDRGDSGNVTSHQVGVYLLKNFDSFYGLGVFNYGHNSNKLTRQITIGGVQQLARSSLKSNQFGTYGEAGLNLDAEAVRFQPFFGLQYLSLTNGSAFEGAGGGVGLNVSGNNTSTLQTHLGARAILQTLRSDSGVEFRPYLSARWAADLLGTDRSTTAGFGGAPAGASWVVTGNHSGRHTGQIGPGFTALVADGVSLFANYDFQFGSHFYSHTGSGGVLFEF
ncbi:MAG: autotransporter outer membrane beta-barrel domain-containing protein [Candidatus Saccharimonas sp.]|nr:autotransporter outer membrane beta-barrel domain-containing protein [Planctomycetaceae bacterium]